MNGCRRRRKETLTKCLAENAERTESPVTIEIMKTWLLIIWAFAVPFVLSAATTDATSDQEQKLIQVLQSNASLAEKDAACAQLKLIGTARCVPALAALLVDEQLSHSARYALEAINLAAADAALLNALPKTRGLTQIGIINSLAVRGDQRAIPALSALAMGSDVPIAFAATRTLGQIGSTDALKRLETVANHYSGPIHMAAVDGVLNCANRLLTSANRNKALPVFERIYKGHEPDYIKIGAYRGVILASGGQGLNLAIKAIEGGPGPEQDAALQLVRDLQAHGATTSFARLVPKVGTPVQLALVEGLGQRADPAAASELASFATSAPPEVRTAIIKSLGSLGDATMVPLLAGFAASGTAAEQAAARQALTELHRGNVTPALLNRLAGEVPSVQAEIARALGSRGDRTAVPRLSELAQGSNKSVRGAALKALAELITADDLAGVVDMVLAAKDPAAREETAAALDAACRRLTTGHRTLAVDPLVTGLRVGSPEARAALLPICSELALPEVRVALRQGLQDSDPQVKSAALRALCDTVDPELIDELVDAARTAKDETIRNLAIAGAVRLATQEESIRISREQQVAVLRVLLSAASSPAQKRMVLAGLSETPVLEALRLVDPLVDDASVQTEAARAAIKIGAGLPGTQAQEALTVLNKALASATDEQTRQALQAAIGKMEANADYITDWQVAGPYRKPDKDYAGLFEVVFPAEVGEGKEVVWKPLPAGTDAARPWVMDLLKSLGGEQCVAYARTWVHCDQDQAARLELGSDDGIKVWLNDKQIYALNTARPLTAGSDKIDVTLHSGWNRLLLKITQNNLGWEFCARFVGPDGTHLQGLQCGATVKPEGAQ